MTPWAWPIGIERHGWQDLCRGPTTRHSYILNIEGFEEELLGFPIIIG